MLAEIISQTEKSERLLERVQRSDEKVRGLRSGDRVFTPLVVAAEFSQGAAPSANLVFNVPADADFWAYRLLLYPYCKVIDPVNGTPDDVVFRSTSFTGEPYATGAIDPDEHYTDFNASVDGVFALIYQGKELQNVDVPFSAAYTVNTGKWAASSPFGAQGSTWAAASQTPGGFVFDIPMFIPRAKNLTLRLTPTYLGIRTIEETIPDGEGTKTIVRQHRYKLVAVLEGEKKVTAFR